MKSIRSATVLAILSGALSFGACSDNGDEVGEPTGTSEQGQLTILLTDAPGDVEEAWVRITRIYLQGGSEDGGRVVLRDEPVIQNLVELANDVAVLVDEAVVPPGSYSQLRFVIPEACIEVETVAGTDVFGTSGFDECGEADGQLQIPSLAQSGLKVNLSGISGGAIQLDEEETIVLVDFDVSQSFGHRAGNSGKWVMHPVIQASELEFAGSILTRVPLAEGVELPEINGEPVTLGDFQAVLLASDGEGGFDTEAEMALGDPDGDGVCEHPRISARALASLKG